MASALALGLLSLLTVAAILSPDQRGSGSHQQLGLPPCTFRVLFGRPCPSCGMTTAWACLVRGRVQSALRANVGGTVLAILAVLAAPWLLVSALRGTWLGWAPNSTVISGVALAIVLITLVDWGVRLTTPIDPRVQGEERPWMVPLGGPTMQST